MNEIKVYDQLDDLHIMITCDDQGYWYWENADTGERSEWECYDSRSALIEAAKDFNLIKGE